MFGDTPSNRAWSTKCSAAYSAREKSFNLVRLIFSSMYNRAPGHPRAMMVWACVRETWKQEMVVPTLARRGDVKYLFTEKWVNWITCKSFTLIIASKLGYMDNTAPTGSSGRQSGRSVGIRPAWKSKARNSASFSHLISTGRYAYSQFWSSISSKVRAYVSSSVSGNSSRACRIRPGMQRRR